MSEYYIESKRKNIKRTDRYRKCKVLNDLDSGEVLLSTRAINPIPIRSNDIYHEVTTNEVGRLDIIAQHYYNNPLLWWIIAQANDIYDPFDVKVGSILRIPDIITLYGNNGILM